jgi:LysR family transcriptional regulator, low CO2-responsive transcriptional regulator
LEQTGRAISLTEAGRELRAACQDIFEKILEVESRLAKMRTITPARIRLAVSTTGKYFAPRLLARFWEAYPGVEVAMSLMNRQQLLHRVEADLDDFYIFSNPPPDIELALHPLLPNLMHVYAREGHPLANRKKIGFKDLADQQFLMREVGSGTRLAAEALFEQHGLTPHVRMELGSNEAIKQAILSGLGIAILSHSTMVTETRKGHIVALDVAGFPIRREWYLAHRKSRALSATASLFLEHARNPDVLAELVESAAA